MRRATSQYLSSDFWRGYFYPRSPCGERLVNTYHRIFGGGISIHALLAESDFQMLRQVRHTQNISIHALLAESDYLDNIEITQAKRISIHALLAESDIGTLRTVSVTKTFLSTLSLRRATSDIIINNLMIRYFYPRSPCGERLSKKQHYNFHIAYFYPRSPCGERPYCQRLLFFRHKISIHALLAESDALLSSCILVYAKISIHALLAESDMVILYAFIDVLSFLSTLSLRRATLRYWSRAMETTDFYPRSPCGERHSFIAITPSNFSFLSTLSLRRATIIS